MCAANCRNSSSLSCSCASWVWIRSSARSLSLGTDHLPFIVAIHAHAARLDHAKAPIDPGAATPRARTHVGTNPLECRLAPAHRDDRLAAFLTGPPPDLLIRHTSPHPSEL